MLAVAEPWLEKKLHATIIISAYYKALRYALAHIERIARPVDVASDEEMLSIISSSIGTKFINRWSKQMCQMALDAVRIVTETQKEKTMVDLKHFVRIERVRACSHALMPTVYCLLSIRLPFSMIELSKG